MRKKKHSTDKDMPVASPSLSLSLPTDSDFQDFGEFFLTCQDFLDELAPPL